MNCVFQNDDLFSTCCRLPFDEAKVVGIWNRLIEKDVSIVVEVGSISMPVDSLWVCVLSYVLAPSRVIFTWKLRSKRSVYGGPKIAVYLNLSGSKTHRYHPTTTIFYFNTRRYENKCDVSPLHDVEISSIFNDLMVNSIASSPVWPESCWGVHQCQEE